MTSKKLSKAVVLKLSLRSLVEALELESDVPQKLKKLFSTMH